MADGNITKDEVYRAVAPTDFESLLELDRYNNRSTAFDKIISATHDHFWDPLSKDYIDFSQPFDMENEALLPEEMISTSRFCSTGLQATGRPQRALMYFANAVTWRASSRVWFAAYSCAPWS